MIKGIRRLLARVLAVASRDEQRLEEEIEEHLASQTDENLRSGLPPAEARRLAPLKFGGVEAIKEEYRDQRGLPLIESFLQDLRFGLRRLRMSPVFSAATSVTLALGIGATTAIFTLVDAVLLKSLPVSNPAQLYRLGNADHCCVWGGYTQEGEFSLVSYDLYKYLRDRTTGFEEMAAFQAGGTFLGVRRAHTAEAAETYFGEFVSGNYFAMFEVGAYAGRALVPADDTPSAAPVAVMSYRVWRDKYGLDPSVIGGAFSINNKPFTVIGVTPPEFYGDTLRVTPPDFFLPIGAEPIIRTESPLINDADIHWLDIIGRLHAGVSPTAIEAQMRVELQQWLQLHAGEMSAQQRLEAAKQTVYLRPAGAGITRMRNAYERWLQILMMVSGFVLLIVCANVANLMLVRGMERRQQTSLSMALGARPSRLVRQALIESLLLSLLGGAAGLLVAFAGTRLILHFAFRSLTAVPISAAPSMPVLLFAVAISLLTGLIFGITPAWISTHADPAEALRGANRSTRKSGSFSRKALVIVQTSLSLVLLCAAGLLTATLRNLEHQDFGFEQDGRVVIHIDPMLAGYRSEQLQTLYDRLHDAFTGIPGALSATTCLYSPLSGDSWNEGVYIQGKPDPGPASDNGASWTRVTSGYFTTLGNPIVKGRAVNEHDSASSPHVAVINEAFARKFLKNEDPIGKHFGKGEMRYAGDYEIVGVAKDMRYLTYGLDKPVAPFFFLPAAQSTKYATPVDTSTELRSHFLHDVIVRLAPGASLSEPVVRRTLASVDPNLPLMRMESLSQQVSGNFNQQRLIARLTSLFGVLALVLASIGVYGVTAYNAGRRINEIGVRMALGAGRGNVISLILRGAFLLIAAGLLAGLPLIFGAGRLLGNQLYGLNQYDVTIISGATAALAVSGLIAAAIPAFRASLISPVDALRSD